MTDFKKPGEYQMRDGRKAVVLGVNPDTGAANRVVGYIAGAGELRTWDESGSFRADVREHPLNLIAPWPVEKDLGWHSVYSQGATGSYATRELADKSAYPSRTHVIHLIERDGVIVIAEQEGVG